ncbi:MAG: hypothetical protein JNM55_10530 [Anaerolineales bacterium]|nr:hypothetical protein [Anaerolineales bacterium]
MSIFLAIYWVGLSPALENWRTDKAIQDFSGEYYMGFYWSWHLSIKTDSTFTLEVFTDMGGQMEYSGNFVVENNQFRLITSDENFNEPTELIPVKWGQRRYIITADMVDDFCYDISQKWEPRDMVVGGPFYLRENDWEKPAEWLPVLLNGFPLCSVSSLFSQ